MLIPANNGTEKPFKSRSGRVLLYCYDLETKMHVYLDVESDKIISNTEANIFMGEKIDV